MTLRAVAGAPRRPRWTGVSTAPGATQLSDGYRPLERRLARLRGSFAALPSWTHTEVAFLPASAKLSRTPFDPLLPETPDTSHGPLALLHHKLLKPNQSRHELILPEAPKTHPTHLAPLQARNSRLMSLNFNLYCAGLNLSNGLLGTAWWGLASLDAPARCLRKQRWALPVLRFRLWVQPHKKSHNVLILEAPPTLPTCSPWFLRALSLRFLL